MDLRTFISTHAEIIKSEDGVLYLLTRNKHPWVYSSRNSGAWNIRLRGLKDISWI